MKSIKIIILFVIGLVILFVINPFHLNAQSKAKIENVDFFPDGTNLIVTYDIVKYKNDETFRIWLNVNTESGQKLVPNALTGDVGSNVFGGSYKRIIWDMKADNVFLNEGIAVTVMAESEFAKNKPSYVNQPQTVNKTGISVGGAMGLSLLLPGLGRRVVSGHGASWLLGVAGYGCIGGAYYMNNSAYNALEDYNNATTTSERDDYFQKAKNHDLYSKILIGTAAAIWVVDLIVTGVKASKNRKSYSDQKMSMVTSYDPVSKQPMIGVKYRF